MYNSSVLFFQAKVFKGTFVTEVFIAYPALVGICMFDFPSALIALHFADSRGQVIISTEGLEPSLLLGIGF